MKMTRCLRPIISLGLAIAALGLVSCASGPSYAEMKAKLPPIPKGNGRVFVYRPSFIGAAVKPSVMIDNQAVGTSAGQGFLYSDQKPGAHEISITTEWKHKNTFTVQAGQPSFVECTVTMGAFVGHIIPNQVTTATGEANIQSCKMEAK
jgi:hypothetical protein